MSLGRWSRARTRRSYDFSGGCGPLPRLRPRVNRVANSIELDQVDQRPRTLPGVVPLRRLARCSGHRSRERLPPSDRALHPGQAMIYTNPLVSRPPGGPTPGVCGRLAIGQSAPVPRRRLGEVHVSRHKDPAHAGHPSWFLLLTRGATLALAAVDADGSGARRVDDGRPFPRLWTVAGWRTRRLRRPGGARVDHRSDRLRPRTWAAHLPHR